MNYTESILRENDYILGRAAMYFARNDRLNQTINVDPAQGLQMLMHLQNLMPTVSSISLTDTQGHYLRAPEVLPTEKSKTFDARTRPWFIGQAEASIFSHYTSPYMDYFTDHPTVTLYKPVISPEGRLKGTLAFHLDLTSMGYTLRQMVAPVQGEFFVVERDGAVVLHPDTGALFKPYVSEALMDKMTSGEGHLFDPKANPGTTTTPSPTRTGLLFIGYPTPRLLPLPATKPLLSVGDLHSQPLSSFCLVCTCAMLPVLC